MNKQNFLTMALFGVMLVLASCGGNNDAKKVKLKTQEDSLNYAMGLVISEDLRMNALQNDSAENTINALLEKFDNYYKNKNNQKEYKTGLKIGNMMKEQLSAGLTGDSTLNFNEELFQKGLVKGISGDTTGITGIQAIIYFQNTIQKIQNAKLLNANPVTVPTDTIKK